MRIYGSAIRKFRRISLEVGREKLGRNNTQVKLEGSKEGKKKERKRGGRKRGKEEGRREGRREGGRKEDPDDIAGNNIVSYIPNEFTIFNITDTIQRKVGKGWL